MSEQLESSMPALMGELLIEARKQTALMQQIANNQLTLIEALAEEPDGQDAQPLTYMDGRPIR
jgi:hypothetical protein